MPSPRLSPIEPERPIRVWRYFWTTIVGYMPVTALSVYFGHPPGRDQGHRPLVTGVIVALLAIGHFIVRRQAAAVKRPA
jgi:uncharacterized membrane protein YdjX (TVP38/TMEM64 family)